MWGCNKVNCLKSEKYNIFKDYFSEGGIPFEVEIPHNDSKVKIIKNIWTFDKNTKTYLLERQLYFSFVNICEAVLGDCVLKRHNYMCGNSILLRADDNKYIYVGGKGVYEIKIDEKIKKLYSHVSGAAFINGRLDNEISYPVAVGEEYVYFMLKMKRIKKQTILDNGGRDTPEFWLNSYHWFWDNLSNHTFERVENTILIE